MGNLDYGQKIEWLSRYRDIEITISKLKERRERVMSHAEIRSTSIVERAQKHCRGPSNRIQLAVEVTEDIDKIIREHEKYKNAYRKQIEKKLLQIEDPFHRRTMRYYYIECLPWVTAAELIGYSERHLRRIHKKIVEGMKI